LADILLHTKFTCDEAILYNPIEELKVPFGCADKLVEKHRWLICRERKTLFWLKKQAEKYGL
jgi:hypothetical protein